MIGRIPEQAFVTAMRHDVIGDACGDAALGTCALAVLSM
jgi:hypothetical protein